ncbi:MAG: pyrrolo-quinoline quinone, partial [Nevskia sp.]|nr:pyrrolo-quinoline quinone [Nevskia sp.]
MPSYQPSRLPLLVARTLVAVATLMLLANCGGGSGGDGSSSSSGATSSSSGAASSSSGSSSSSSSSGSSTISILTYHNDLARTGQNLAETILTPTTVKSATFGKVGFLTTQGKVDAQPLYVSKLGIAGGTHNTVFVVTEHAMAYAFDADTYTPLWQVSLLGSGETPSGDHGCNQISPEIGITATPVIDPGAGAHGAIYMVAMSKDGSGGFHQRLHALDLSSGAELGNSPAEIQAVYPSKAGQVTFSAGQYAERSALLLLNGTLYLSWTSHCDQPVYSGWVMGYNPSTLKQSSVINITPNGNEGAIWMAGAGPAADDAGNIYFLSANGTFDTVLDSKSFPVNGDFGNAFVKLSTAGGTLAVADYFTMHNTVAESNADQDLGSGGLLLLPDVKDSTGVTRHLVVGGGKDAAIYVINRDAMG